MDAKYSKMKGAMGELRPILGLYAMGLVPYPKPLDSSKQWLSAKVWAMLKTPSHGSAILWH